MAAQTIVSGGVPSMRYLEVVDANLAAFEPAELREQVTASWAREPTVRTQEEFAEIMGDQLPFHFADPRDPRIADYAHRTGDTVYAPDVLRVFSANGYGGIEVEERLCEVASSVLVATGRHDRTCSVAAAEAIAAGIPNSELEIFERSGHMTFVEEPELYNQVVRRFLTRTA